jgi:hypothetical protein
VAEPAAEQPHHPTNQHTKRLTPTRNANTEDTRKRDHTSGDGHGVLEAVDREITPNFVALKGLALVLAKNQGNFTGKHIK